MANRYRGEIEARLNGKSHRLCLTLGALAELEAAFGADDMVALAQRFEQGRIRSIDAMKIIGAGLRGAGCEISDADVATMRADDAAAGYVDIVARLLRATFATELEQPAAQPGDPLAATEAGEAARPFPGKT